MEESERESPSHEGRKETIASEKKAGEWEDATLFKLEGTLVAMILRNAHRKKEEEERKKGGRQKVKRRKGIKEIVGT